jgi:putative ABC transport system permease protein
VTRWAWRLFRREWRQQLLLLAMLTVAVAATTVGAGLAANTDASQTALFGNANTLITLSGTDPNLTADIAAIEKRYGTSEEIVHGKISVPGSANGIDLRAQDPAGVYSHPTLRLDAGRYPKGSGEIAVTSSVATIFNLHLGGSWEQDGAKRLVVGVVENPLNLLDKFALVAPGQVRSATDVTVLVRSTGQGAGIALSGDGASVQVRGTGQAANAAIAVLVLATIGLLFIGLVAVAGFTVLAQRRLRALGMIAAIGATDRHVRLVLLANGGVVGVVGAVAGTAVGLGGWFIVAPRLEGIAEHRIDPFHLPWWAIVVSMLLAVTTAVAAAWWPARSAARIPIVAALSARPARPRPAHRFALLGGLLLIVGLVLLVESHERRTVPIITGIVTTTVGMLLLAPVGIAGLAIAGRRSPIALRLALRDLARYQARSGAALAAVTLAVGISAVIVISAAASEAAAAVPPTGGNLPRNELIVWLSADGGAQGLVPALSAAQLRTVESRTNALAGTLHANSVLALEGALSPSAPNISDPGSGASGRPLDQLGQGVRESHNGKSGVAYDGRNSIAMYVATPAVLARYGIKPGGIDPATGLLTSHQGLVLSSRIGLGSFQLIGSRPVTWQPKVQTVALPTYSSEPTTLITEQAMQSLGLSAVPVGWLIQTPHDLTDAQISKAQQLALAAGVSVETRPTRASLSKLRSYATAAGVAVALGVLAMTVGLIRSETAGDLRTLTATGANSRTRRILTGATAGSLGLLGGLLGTAGAYLALIAWYHSNLHWLTYVPFLDLLAIVVGLPVLACAASGLLAGREPPTISRQAIE